jgi:hypothetical protein
VSLALLVVSTLVAQGASAKEFVVGSVGPHHIVGAAEGEWVITSSPSPMHAAATARLTQGDRPDVVVLITVMLPPPGSPLSTASAEDIARLVSASAEQAAAHSVEGNLKVESFSAGRVQGSYFSATDKAPKPGEFKYMSQGLAALGDLAVTFTALSHADPVGARDAMLAIAGSLQVRSAKANSAE